MRMATMIPTMAAAKSEGRKGNLRLDHEDSHGVAAEAEKDHVAKGCISRKSGNEIQSLGEHGIEKDTGQQPDPESRGNVAEKSHTEERQRARRFCMCDPAIVSCHLHLLNSMTHFKL